jgi:hypothetical protein
MAESAEGVEVLNSNEAAFEAGTGTTDDRLLSAIHIFAVPQPWSTHPKTFAAVAAAKARASRAHGCSLQEEAKGAGQGPQELAVGVECNPVVLGVGFQDWSANGSTDRALHHLALTQSGDAVMCTSPSTGDGLKLYINAVSAEPKSDDQDNGNGRRVTLSIGAPHTGPVKFVAWARAPGAAADAAPSAIVLTDALASPPSEAHWVLRKDELATVPAYHVAVPGTDLVWDRACKRHVIEIYEKHGGPNQSWCL